MASSNNARKDTKATRSKEGGNQLLSHGDCEQPTAELIIEWTACDNNIASAKRSPQIMTQQRSYNQEIGADISTATSPPEHRLHHVERSTRGGWGRRLVSLLIFYVLMQAPALIQTSEAFLTECYHPRSPGAKTDHHVKKNTGFCHLQATKENTYLEGDSHRPQVGSRSQSVSKYPSSARHKSFRTEQQQRQKPQNRRPKFYWQDIQNVEQELRDFWTDCCVDIYQTDTYEQDSLATKAGKRQKRSSSTPPLCIPNETLLNYFGRHDLRAAIVTHGGRVELSFMLPGGATIMPGKWQEAVATGLELQLLLQNQTHHLDLSRDGPPLLRQPGNKSKLATEPNNKESTNKVKKWSHQKERKPLGYWSQQRVVAELYDYLDEYQNLHGRPSVWFPRPSELQAKGRDDLALAMRRFGGAQRIAEIAGLIPFREWNFFEGQYELLLLLKEFLDETSSLEEDIHKYRFFPKIADIRSRGYDRLYLLIQYYGGTKFLSSRLGMKTTSAYIRAADADDMHRTSAGRSREGGHPHKLRIRTTDGIDRRREPRGRVIARRARLR